MDDMRFVFLLLATIEKIKILTFKEMCTKCSKILTYLNFKKNKVNKFRARCQSVNMAEGDKARKEQN